MDKISKIAFCPHCGNKAPQRLIHVQTCEWVGRTLLDDEELDVGRTYFVASCGTCNHILLYSMYGDDHGEEDYAEIFAESHLEYPDSGHLDFSVPASIKQVYENAARIKLSNPDAFAAQIRRALEALCKDRGAEGENLHDMIKDLVNLEKLPATLAAAAGLLKDMGNKGAHADNETIRLNQVDALDKFFRAIVEYVYVAPSMVEALRDSRSRSKSQGEDEG